MRFTFLCGILVLLFAAGCTPKESSIVVHRVPTVFIPENEFFDCPRIEQFPDTNKLTDGDVAELILALDENNQRCYQSVQEIKRQLFNAKIKLEENQGRY